MNNVNNTDAKIKTDALGVLPEQLNGGTTANRQLMAHIGPIRAVIASKLGVKLDHMRISNKMWNVLKELEAEDRINAVKKLEEEKDIYRDISRGNFVVSNSPPNNSPYSPTLLRHAPNTSRFTAESRLDDAGLHVHGGKERWGLQNARGDARGPRCTHRDPKGGARQN